MVSSYCLVTLPDYFLRLLCQFSHWTPQVRIPLQKRPRTRVLHKSLCHKEIKGVSKHALGGRPPTDPQAVESAGWKNFGDVRQLFGGADQVGKFVVFNVAGNKYRLIVVIHYDRQRCYVRHIMTHKEYDLGKWKKG